MEPKSSKKNKEKAWPGFYASNAITLQMRTMIYDAVFCTSVPLCVRVRDYESCHVSNFLHITKWNEKRDYGMLLFASCAFFSFLCHNSSHSHDPFSSVYPARSFSFDFSLRLVDNLCKAKSTLTLITTTTAATFVPFNV